MGEIADLEMLHIARHPCGEGYIAEIELRRSDKSNAVNGQVLQEMLAVIRVLQADSELKAVTISGAGKHFCAGLDFAIFSEMQQGQVVSESIEQRCEGEDCNIFQFAALGWRQIPVPVIAAIHGAAYGAGCQIALGADIRLAAPDARFSLKEINWGLIPDMGLSVIAPELFRADVLRELVFTGRIVKAEEAATLGLVTRVVPDAQAEAMKLAQEIGLKSPHALRAAKKLLNTAWLGSPHELLILESSLSAQLVGSPNQQEAIAANFAGRTPSFTKQH